MATETEQCENKGRWWNGCKFEPRYDRHSENEALNNKLTMQWALSDADKVLLSNNIESVIYVHDVCIRCGKVSNDKRKVTKR